MIESTAGPTDGPSAADAESLLVTITTRLADARGVGATDLPPLYEYVDVEALVALFHTPETGAGPSGHVTFQVEEHEVRVYHDGTVEVDGTGADRTPVDAATGE